MVDKLHFESFGQGQPLVLLHGWGLNSGVWQPLIEKFSGQYRVICIDLPGFGQNVDCVPEPYNLDTICTMLVHAIPRPAIYLGWSLGGLVASQLALNFPEQVQALVTVASSPCFLQQQHWPGIKPNVLHGFHQQLARNSQQTIANFLKIQAMGSPHIREDIRLLQQLIMQYPQPSAKTLVSSLKLLEFDDLRVSIAKLTQPMLRLYGQLDSLVPNSIPALMQNLLPKSEQYIFAKASHAPFISHPEDFIQILQTWLAKQSYLSR